MADLDPKELRQQFSDDTAEWADIRREGQKDMRYVAGDPWEEAERHARADAKRLCLSLDELGQYINQAINDVRQNKRGIRVSPIGRGANDQTAAFRQGKIRDIEYRSNAQQSYTTMFENAIQRGYGFLRVTAQYAQPNVTDPDASAFDQELRIEPVVNPDMVTPDPYAIRADFSDGKRLWYHESWSKEDFKARWPKATTTNDFSALVQAAPTWIKANRPLVAERWVKEVTGQRDLYLLKPTGNGLPQQVVFGDTPGFKKPTSDLIDKTRKVDQVRVRQQIMNGLEVLEEHGWPGPSIPWVSCYGKVLYVDTGQGSKRHILSLIRLARDPYMLYCYYRTAEAELVGMTPKFPYFVYEGQLSTSELANLQASLQVPVAVIQVKPQLDAAGQQLLPMPQRNPYEPPIAALEMGAEAARRAIQAAMGISPLPSQAQKHNEKSGVALRQIEESSQKGTFHFTDHYDEAITRTGAILDELLPFYYDTARDTSVRKPDDSVAVVRINDDGKRYSPGLEPADGENGQPLSTNTGDHDVTISVGPAMASEREASSNFADTIVSSPEIVQVVGPQKMQKLIAQAIKLKGLGPIGDQMADVIDPPQENNAQAMQQQMAQMQQMVQQLQQQLQQAVIALQTKQVEAQSKEKIETFKAQASSQQAVTIQTMKDKTAVAIEKIRALVKSTDTDKQAEIDLIAMEHEAALQKDAQMHEMRLAEMEHEHKVDEEEQAHEHTMEAGEQGITGQMAVQASKPPAGDRAQA